MDEANKEELLLIKEFRNNLGDLRLAKHHLETRNLLRFLRARNGSIKNAENMFRQQIGWREDNMIDSILEWDTPKEFKTYWPYAISGFDEDGSPVAIIEFGLWDPTKVNENYESYQKHIYQGIECMWHAIQLKSQGQKVFKQFYVLFDIKGLSFGTVTTFNAIHGLVDGARQFEANYPETMKTGVFLNAPWVFEIVWRLLKPLVSDHTYSKLKFLGGEEHVWKDELAKCMPMEKVWEKYGGMLPDLHDISTSMIGPKRKEANHANYNELNANERMKAEEKVV